jgi:hypothetical protein
MINRDVEDKRGQGTDAQRPQETLPPFTESRGKMAASKLQRVSRLSYLACYEVGKRLYARESRDARHDDESDAILRQDRIYTEVPGHRRRWAMWQVTL